MLIILNEATIIGYKIVSKSNERKEWLGTMVLLEYKLS